MSSHQASDLSIPSIAVIPVSSNITSQLVDNRPLAPNTSHTNVHMRLLCILYKIERNAEAHVDAAGSDDTKCTAE